jgi:hypothetical protein
MSARRRRDWLFRSAGPTLLILTFAMGSLASAFPASDANAAPVWNTFISNNGFSVEYPQSWAKSDPDWLSGYAEHGHDGLYIKDTPETRRVFAGPILPYQADIDVELEGFIPDINTILKRLDFESPLVFKYHNHADGHRYHIRHVSIDRHAHRGCKSGIEISYMEEVTSYYADQVKDYAQPGHGSPVYLQKDTIYCAIGNRGYSVELTYWSYDSRKEELEQILMHAAKSLRRVPLKIDTGRTVHRFAG